MKNKSKKERPITFIKSMPGAKKKKKKESSSAGERNR